MAVRKVPRLLTALFGLLLALEAALGFLLFRQQGEGPQRSNIDLGQGVPATLYMPPTDDTDPPPLVIVGHGYSSDRVGMSPLARSLATAGYSVLVIDFRGFGSNRNGFDGDRLTEDLDTALDWVERSSDFDPQGVAVLGHSMGANAAVEFAASDDRVAATVAISGGPGWDVGASAKPANLLLLVAQGDEATIGESNAELARSVAAADVAEGRTYGSPSSGTGVRLEGIDATNHITVLWSPKTVEEAVSWLDEVFDVQGNPSPGLRDPRLGTAFFYAALAVLLVLAIGLLSGRFAEEPSTGSASGIPSLLIVAIALLFAAPLTALTSPISSLVVGFGDIASYLGFAGVLLLLLSWSGRLGRALSPSPTPLRDILMAVRPASIAVVSIAVVFAPLTLVFHAAEPTPERVLAFAVIAIAIFPFSFFLQAAIRRGGPRVAAGWALTGRALLLAALFVGIRVGLFPGLIGSGVPALLVAYCLTELFAAAAYFRSKNSAVIALVEAVWVAGLMSITMPMH